MDKDQWLGFFISGGKISLTEWVELNEENRDLAVEAGRQFHNKTIGNIGKACQDLVHALDLIGDKEDLEELFTAQRFEAFNNMIKVSAKERAEKAEGRKRRAS
jgi:hypothetical protein